MTSNIESINVNIQIFGLTFMTSTLTIVYQKIVLGLCYNYNSFNLLSLNLR
jgi:hypothetical protein